MATDTNPSLDTGLNIQNKNIECAPGVTIDDHQKTIIGSVMDLFDGKPSLKKLQLWQDDAVFEDPICIARGRYQYQPQWYGLVAAFSKIERISHQVTSAGNPIEIDNSSTYTVRGLNKATTINSKIRIYTDAASGKITKVEDRWNGNLPNGTIANAFRRLNAATVPKFVGVPKTEEEDAKKTL